MTSESKILTVSYGTFSCTLEGFENPFDTMKAIAEYFRDLAAQDRHFGAEPPPPDAAMLHRLAEREVARLAAAGRATEAPATEAPGDAPVAESAVSPRIQFNPAGRRPARNVNLPEAPAAAVDTAPPEPSLQDIIPDGVAAKLARIRRSVHPTAAEATGTSAFVADAAADAPVTEPADDAAPLAASDLTDAALDGAEAVEAAADIAEAAGEATPDFAARLNEGLADDDAPARVTAAFAEDYSEPSIEAQDVLEDAPWNVSIQEDAVEELAVAEAAPLDALVDADAELPSDSAAEDLADLARLDGEAFDEAALAAALDDSLPEDAPAEMTLAEAEAIDPLPEAVDVAAEVDAPIEAAADAVADPVEETALAETDVEEVPAATGRRNSLRVVRLRPDGATPRDPAATRVLSRQEETDEVARLMQQAEEVMADDENRRRQEALSRLKAAIVSTEADRADLDYEAPRADVNLDPYRDDLAEAIQPDEPAPPPPPPEVKPRRKSVPLRTQDQPRPGTIRPGMISPPPLVLVSEQRVDRVAPAAASLAPASLAPASLAPAEPGIAPAHSDQPMPGLRTGRLSGAIGSGAAVAMPAAPARGIVLEKPSYGPATDADDDEDLAEDAREIDESGLAAFAETVGARSMVEMLEAAAAFATCVEKREQFTRPQLMRRMMASAGGKPVSREDGLRSFGTLLRTGRIEKVTRGHYALAESSPYLAEARRLN